MSTAGPNSPSSSTGSTWTNPGNAYAPDDSWAYTETERADILKLTGFGFSIPTGSTIDGVSVSIERHASTNFKASGVADNTLQLVIEGTETGSNKAITGTKWPTSDAIATYGGAADLWGLTPTVDQINASDFGVYLVVSPVFAGAYVDTITITVTYTEGGGSSFQTAWARNANSILKVM